MGHRQRTTGPVVFACELVLLPVVVLLDPFPDGVEISLLLKAVLGPMSYFAAGPACALDAFALSFSWVTFALSVLPSFSSFPVFSFSFPIFTFSTFAFP